jgi:hypothetical protein
MFCQVLREVFYDDTSANAADIKRETRVLCS